MKVTVLSGFRDITDNRIFYNIGDVVDFEDNERVNSLIERKLVKAFVEQSKKDDKVASNTVNIYQSAAKIKEDISFISDKVELQRALSDEMKAEKPRKGVITMLEERISEL